MISLPSGDYYLTFVMTYDTVYILWRNGSQLEMQPALQERARIISAHLSEMARSTVKSLVQPGWWSASLLNSIMTGHGRTTHPSETNDNGGWSGGVCGDVFRVVLCSIHKDKY